MNIRSITSTAVVATLSITLAGCAGQSEPAAVDDATIAVVASTNFYGDIARSVGGDLIEVTSIIGGTGRDPHEYEANAQDQLVFSKADLVIENGGGYDDFVGTLLASADNSDATVLNAVDISGYDQEPAEGAFNEHMWYDFPSVSKLVDEIVSVLSDTDPDNAATYSRNGEAFKADLVELEAQEDKLKASHAGEGVAITEPVPMYMLDAIGLKNLTPGEFSEAVEEDTDVPAAALDETLGLFSGKRVKLLAYNEQTTGPQTEAVLAAAQENAIAVVPVTETLPRGKTYVEWMKGNLDAISAALGG